MSRTSINKTMKQATLLFLGCTMALFSCSTNKQVGQKGTPIFVEPIAVQAYSFRNYFPKDMIGTLDKIEAMGITAIEGSGGAIPPEEFKKLCEKRGITILSTGVDYNDLKSDPMQAVELAKTLNVQYVMCPWIPHERNKFNLKNAQEAVEVFNNAGKVLQENGITLCYHPHGYEFQPYEQGTLLNYIIENTNPEYVSFQMDIFWIQFGGGDPVALLKQYGERWKMMHLKDMKKGIQKDLTGGTDVENDVPLGQGQIDIRNILIEARKIGVVHYFIEDESSSVMQQVPASIAYLKSLTY